MTKKSAEAKSRELDGATLILMLRGFWAGEKRGFIEVSSSIDLRHAGRAWHAESTDLYLNFLTKRGLLLVRRDKDGELCSLKPSKLGRDLIRAVDGLVFSSADFSEGSFCPSLIAGAQALAGKLLTGSSQKRERMAKRPSEEGMLRKTPGDTKDAEAYRLLQAEELIKRVNSGVKASTRKP